MENLQTNQCLFPPIMFMLFGANSGGSSTPTNTLLQMNGAPLMEQSGAVLLQMQSA